MIDRTRLTLERIARLLDGGLDPARVIEATVPTDKDTAIALARRFHLWEEYRDEFGSHVVAIARLATRRGMKRHRIEFAPDGRVLTDAKANPEPRPLAFDLGGTTDVTYTRRYIAHDAKDLFYFVGRGNPPAPHPLSEGGYWPHFAPSDAVDAFGSPEAIVQALAEAKVSGKLEEFERAFEDPWATVRKRVERPAKAAQVVPEPPAEEPPAVEKPRRVWVETAAKPVERGLF